LTWQVESDLSNSKLSNNEVSEFVQNLDSLSDGYPKEYRENLEWRAKMLLKAKKDKSYRAKIKELFHRDILFAFNGFFYTFDPRRRPMHHQPFCTYPFQDKAILELKESIEKGKDICIEKSRDMGVSWMVILVFVWFWLKPDGGTDFLFGSRIEDYVDKKGDMRTLFEKARYAYKRLPFWLRPDGFSPNKHDNYMKLVNPQTGASITGESNNANFSTGGRYAGILFDEFAKWESTDESAWTAAGDATPCRIAVSTPFGAAGQYYNLVTDGKTKKVTLHWSLHPRKNPGLYCVWPIDSDTEEVELRSPWYDLEDARRRPLEMAQELDINYIGAGNPVFDGKAGKRIARLLNIKKDPVALYSIDINKKELLKNESELRDYEAYFVSYEEPSKQSSYVLGVDVAEGKELGDFSVIKILNRQTKSLAGSYFSRIDEVNLAKVIVAISKFYTEKSLEAPWVGVETIGPGLATFDFCMEYEVDNLFMEYNFDSALQKPSFRKGWRTSASSRKILVAGVREWLFQRKGWVDPRCLREMTTFVINKTGKPEAKTGANDDEVIAFGIAIQVDILAPGDEYQEEVPRREDGLPETVFTLKGLEVEGDPVTIEERCYASLMDRKEIFVDDVLDQFYGGNYG
jgi:hypothetical protein